MGSNPGLITGQVPTAAQWNSYFTAKMDDPGFTPLNAAGGVMSGEIITVASTTSTSGLNLPPGSAPATPLLGDIWMTTTGLYADIGGLVMSLGGWNLMTAFAKNVNLNAAGDTPINMIVPTTSYILEAVWIFNTGTMGTLSTVKVGLFSLAGGSGINLLASGTGGSALSAITSGGVNNLANATVLTSNSGVFNFANVFFRVITPQGGPAAVPVDVYISIHPIPT